MKDMFDRTLKKWDVVAAQDEDGDMFLCVVVAVDEDEEDVTLRQIYSDAAGLDPDTFTYSSEYVLLLSVPEEIKIMLDTMKFAGEDL